MNSRWETHKGDEWWYSDFWGEASASAGPVSLSIGRIDAKQGQLTENRLHQLLWVTHQQFPDQQIWCYLDEQTTSLMNALTEKGLVRWELIQNPYSTGARLLDIKPPG